MKIKKPSILVLSILAPLFAGFIGSIFTVNSVQTWYATLNKPYFTPPSWLFGPVWTILYILMGVALYRVFLKVKNPLGSKSIQLFLVHLVVNAGWSIVFFGLKNPGLAMAVIVILWGMIAYLIKLFSKIDRVAGILLLPYIAWVTFASYLNFAIWRLN